MSGSATVALPRRRRAEVFAAAAKVFSSRGYGGATIREIADEVGLDKGSIYYYVASKEDLLFGVLDKTQGDVEAILHEVEAMPDLAPLDRLREYVRRQVHYSCHHATAVAVYHSEFSHLGTARRRELGDRRRRHIQFVSDMLEEHRSLTGAEVDDAPAIVHCVFGTIISVHQWFRAGGPFTAEQAAETCANFALGGATHPVVRGRGTPEP